MKTCCRVLSFEIEQGKIAHRERGLRRQDARSHSRCGTGQSCAHISFGLSGTSGSRTTTHSSKHSIVVRPPPSMSLSPSTSLNPRRQPPTSNLYKSRCENSHSISTLFGFLSSSTRCPSKMPFVNSTPNSTFARFTATKKRAHGGRISGIFGSKSGVTNTRSFGAKHLNLELHVPTILETDGQRGGLSRCAFLVLPCLNRRHFLTMHGRRVYPILKKSAATTPQKKASKREGWSKRRSL